LDEALEEISQNRGTLYDPEVVEVCLKLFAERGFAFDQERRTASSPDWKPGEAAKPYGSR